MKRMRKVISFVLTAVMVIGLLPVLRTGTLAADVAFSGYCGAEGENGENITWTLDGSGVLTLSGEGRMKDYGSEFNSYSNRFNHYYTNAPWGGSIENTERVKKVAVNEGITYIGNNAFNGCTAMTEADIPESLTAIGDRAFGDCSSLTEIDIPKSVTRIGYGTFYCAGLKKFFVHSEMEQVSGESFEGCADLSDITADPNNKTYFSVNDCLIHKGRLTLVLGGENCVIPDDGRVTSIGYGAFLGRLGLTDIKIPDDVKEIDDWAFSNSGLIDVTIPGSITRLGTGVFYGCLDLIEVTISDGVKFLPKQCFDSTNLEIVTLPLSVTEINKFAFSYWEDTCQVDDFYYAGTEEQWNKIKWSGTTYYSLSEVTFPDEYTANSNIHFESVAPYHRVEEHTWDFGTITTYPTASESGLMTYACTDPQCGVTRTEVIPATYGHTGAVELMASGTVPAKQFYKKTAHVLSEEPLKWTLTSAGVLELSGEGAMSQDYYDGAPWGEYADFIVSVVIKYGVTSISSGAFAGLENLKEAVIAETTGMIDGNAFHSCVNMVKVTIPEGVTNIMDNAFAGCYSLRELHLPASLERLGNGPFYGCSQLKTITVAPGNENYFVNGNCLVRIDRAYSPETKEYYVTGGTILRAGADNVIPADPAVTAIAYPAFTGCKDKKGGVTNLSIPANIVSLDTQAFTECPNISTITVDAANPVFRSAGNCVIDRETNAVVFGCKNSKIPTDGSVTAIAEGAFYDCTSLTELTIPDSITRIGYHAFAASGLKDIYFYGSRARWNEIISNPGVPDGCVIHFGMSIPGCSKGDHTWDKGAVTKEATCGDKGQKTYKCEVCGSAKTEDIPPTGNHTWDGGVVTKESTCANKGQKVYRCTVCDATRPEDIPATGKHTWDAGKVTKQPTATEKGEKTYTCTVCKTTKKEDIPATGTPAHEHIWDDGKVTKEATCGAKGERTYTCTVCKTTKKEDIPATGNHTWDAGKVTKEPTATEKGERTYTCAVCKTTKKEDIPATGTPAHEHIWDDGTVTKEPTCGAKGEKTYTCTVCGEPKTEEIPATGNHVWDEGKVTKEPTATEKGEKTYTCTVCKTTRTEDVPATGTPAHEHVWDGGKVTKEATCAAKGERTYTCTICQITKTEEIPATGNHVWDEGKVTKEPTATEKGEKTYTCTVCQTTKTEELQPAAEIIASGDISLLDGEFGDHVTWNLYSNGALVISGEGETTPAYGVWSDYEEYVMNVLIEEGVSSIGGFLLSGYENLETVEIPVSVTTINSMAFDDCPPITIRYAGTEEQWNAIEISDGALPENYTIVYGSGGTEEQPGDLPEGIRQTEDGIRALPGQKKEDVLTGGLAGAVIRKRDGSELADGEALGSGMIIVMQDGTEQTVVVKGDNDGNGEIESADARLALRASVGLEQFENWQEDASLVAGEAVITPSDARLILRASVGLENYAAWL